MENFHEFTMFYAFLCKNAEESINSNSQSPEDLHSNPRSLCHSWLISSVLLMGILEICQSYECLNNSGTLIFKYSNSFPSLSCLPQNYIRDHYCINCFSMAVSRAVSKESLATKIQNIKRHSLLWSCKLSAYLNFAS